jgi:hypothetical protein
MPWGAHAFTTRLALLPTIIGIREKCHALHKQQAVH